MNDFTDAKKTNPKQTQSNPISPLFCLPILTLAHMIDFKTCSLKTRVVFLCLLCFLWQYKAFQFSPPRHASRITDYRNMAVEKREKRKKAPFDFATLRSLRLCSLRLRYASLRAGRAGRTSFDFAFWRTGVYYSIFLVKSKVNC